MSDHQENTGNPKKVLSKAERITWYKERIQLAELDARLKKAYRDQAVYEFERLEAFAKMAQLQGSIEAEMARQQKAAEERAEESKEPVNSVNTNTATTESSQPEQPAQDPKAEVPA